MNASSLCSVALAITLGVACANHDDKSATANASPLADPLASGDFTSASSWESYDLASVLGTSHGGFCGAAFDGRYLYLVPCYTHDFVRFDTHGAFTSAGSYATMAGARVAGAGSFDGAVFDGRYVYYIPAGRSVVRYDTKAAFEDPSSYTAFDLSAAGAPATAAFSGGTFDGRYVYFVPQGIEAFSGYAMRFDTRAEFSTAASYEGVDLASLDPDAVGFKGAAFDGHYVYFAPFARARLARYDTAAPFGAAGFSFVAAAGSSGAAFDGQFVNLVPGGVLGYVQLYDTRGPADSGAALARFDPSGAVGQLQAYGGALFDGRYVYFGSTASGGTSFDPGSLVLRRDTHGALRDAASWAKFDVGTLSPAAGNFHSMALDERWVYFIPWQSTVVARFDTGRTAPLPPTTHGSFY